MDMGRRKSPHRCRGQTRATLQVFEIRPRICGGTKVNQVTLTFILVYCVINNRVLIVLTFRNRTGNQLKMKWWIMGKDYDQGPEDLNQKPNSGFRKSMPSSPKPDIESESDEAPTPSSLSVSSESTHFPDLHEDFQMSVEDFESALREDSVVLSEGESQLDPEVMEMTEHEMEDAIENLEKNFTVLNKKKLLLQKVVKRKGPEFEISDRYKQAVANLKKTEQALNHAQEQLLLKQKLLSKSEASPTPKSSSFLLNTPKKKRSRNKRSPKTKFAKKKRIRRQL